MVHKVLSNDIHMTICEYDVYIQSIDEVESRIVDDSKFPVVKDNKKNVVRLH